MRERGEEPDYSVRTKLKRDPKAFAELVRNAFAVEFNCTKDVAIARTLDLSPGWISDLFKHPANVESEAIDRLIKPLHLRSRRLILRAWVDLRFNVDITESKSPSFKRVRPTEVTLQRVRRYTEIGEPRLAAGLALRAFNKATDRTLKERFLDEALRAHQRSALPGRAMSVARLIAQSGREHHDIYREAHGYLARAIVLLQMPNAKPVEVGAAIDDAFAVLTSAAGPPAPCAYAIATHEDLERLRRNATVVFMERSEVPHSELALREMLEFLLPRTQIGRKGLRMFLHHLIARIYLLLGESFKAEEHLELGFRVGGVKTMRGRDLCAVVKGRIMERVEGLPAARAYLARAESNAFSRWDLALVNAIESDLARIESRLFRDAELEIRFTSD